VFSPLVAGNEYRLLRWIDYRSVEKLVNAIGNFNPGNLGTYEGGNVLIGRIFGLTSATGLALAFARRLRALFWTAVGGVCLLWLARKSSNLRAESVENELLGKTADPQDRVAGHNSSPDGITVAIALNAAGVNLNGFSPALARVGDFQFCCGLSLERKSSTPQN